MAYAYLPAREIDGGTHGMAILSRRPISNLRFMDLPFFGTSIRSDGRVALAATVAGVDVVNIHLFLQLSLSERIVQLAPATRSLLDRAIIGGDFNTNPYGWTDMLPNVALDPISDIDGAAVVDDAMVEFGYQAATRDSGPTHRSPHEELRLDSIYVRDLETIGSQVLRQADLSDHWPLWVDVVL